MPQAQKRLLKIAIERLEELKPNGGYIIMARDVAQLIPQDIEAEFLKWSAAEREYRQGIEKVLGLSPCARIPPTGMITSWATK